MGNAVSSGWLACALALLASGRSAAAHDGLHEEIARLSSAIERDPCSAELHLRRAELHRLHRDWNAALSDLRRAEALDPRLDGLYLAGARIQLDAGGLGAARDLLGRQLALHPGDPRALLVKAELELRQGAVEEAVRDYDQAIAGLELPEPDPYLARAEALVSLGPEGVARALEGLDAGLVRLGPVAALELRAVELELARGRSDDALARVDALAARSPRQERWLAWRGEILLEARRPAEAHEAFAAARIALESLSPRARASAAVRELEEEVACRLAELGGRSGRESKPREGREEPAGN